MFCTLDTIPATSLSVLQSSVHRLKTKNIVLVSKCHYDRNALQKTQTHYGTKIVTSLLIAQILREVEKIKNTEVQQGNKRAS